MYATCIRACAFHYCILPRDRDRVSIAETFMRCMFANNDTPNGPIWKRCTHALMRAARCAKFV